MMRWKSLLAVAVSSVLFGACTVTTGSGSDSDDDSFEDDDDVSIDNQETNFDDDFEDDDFQDPDELDETDDSDETDAGSSDETTTDEPTSDTTDTGETTSEEDGGDATDETTSDSTDTDGGADETTDDTTDGTADDTGETTDEGDGGPAACEVPEAAPPSCEACLEESCGAEYEACFCDPTCNAELAAVRSCYAEKNTLDNPSDDQAGDWAACEEMAQGDDGELSTLYYDLLSCVGGPYMPEPDANPADDPYMRTDGDGTCTAACFGLFSFPE